MAALLAGGLPAAAETTIVFNTFLAPNDALGTNVMLPRIADVEKVTEGRVTCTVPASALAPPPERCNAVQQGVADGAFRVMGFLRAAPPRTATAAVADDQFRQRGNHRCLLAHL